MKYAPLDNSYQLIMPIVCEALNVSEKEIKSQSRKKEIVEARQIFTHLVSAYHPEMTLLFRGKLINRHHSTIIHNLGVVNDLLAIYPKFKLKYQKINQKINQKLNQKMNNQDQLTELKCKAEVLHERLQQIKDVNSIEFAETQSIAKQVVKDIEAIEAEIASHVSRINGLLNTAQEHVAGVFTSPAIEFSI